MLSFGMIFLAIGLLFHFIAALLKKSNFQIVPMICYLIGGIILYVSLFTGIY